VESGLVAPGVGVAAVFVPEMGEVAKLPVDAGDAPGPAGTSADEGVGDTGEGVGVGVIIGVGVGHGFSRDSHSCHSAASLPPNSFHSS
jgi:hypothetical protein